MNILSDRQRREVIDKSLPRCVLSAIPLEVTIHEDDEPDCVLVKSVLRVPLTIKAKIKQVNQLSLFDIYRETKS